MELQLRNERVHRRGELTGAAALGCGLWGDVHHIGVPVEDLDVDVVGVAKLQACQCLRVVHVVAHVRHDLTESRALFILQKRNKSTVFLPIRIPSRILVSELNPVSEHTAAIAFTSPLDVQIVAFGRDSRSGDQS